MSELVNASSNYSKLDSHKNNMAGTHMQVDPVYELITTAQDKILSVEEIESFSKSYKNTIRNKNKRSNNFYSLLIFSLTHELFEEDESREYWDKICEHRNHLNHVLDRDVGITVATLDYMKNIRENLTCPKIIVQNKSEDLIKKVAKDTLTHLYMRGIFDATLKDEFNKSLHSDGKLVLALIDIDDFKSINDTYGHQVGDEVLSAIGNTINKSIRKKGIAARYGGEELAIIFPDIGLVEAYNIVERIRRRIEKHYKNSINTTVSIGLAEIDRSVENPQDLIRLADSMLYRAKATGKNKIEQLN